MGRSIVQLQQAAALSGCFSHRSKDAAELCLRLAAVIPHVSTGMLAHFGKGLVKVFCNAIVAPTSRLCVPHQRFVLPAMAPSKHRLATLREPGFQIEKHNLGAAIHEISAHGCGDLPPQLRWCNHRPASVVIARREQTRSEPQHSVLVHQYCAPQICRPQLKHVHIPNLDVISTRYGVFFRLSVAVRKYSR